MRADCSTMSFASFQYCFVFLPVTVAGFWIIQNRSARAALWWLAGASVVFYARWSARDLVIAGISIFLNYVAATAILKRGLQAKPIFIAAVTANLLGLCYYKYLGFISGLVVQVTGRDELAVLGISLPLGISFFTFTQIAYLADCLQKKVKQQNWRDYFLFVTFFPHLVAGPILHHGNIIPQFHGLFREDRIAKFQAAAVLFTIGLFKKVIIADTLAKLVDPVFIASDKGELVNAWDALIALLGYAAQLYFDFSGYSDMAVGSALAVGIRIPFNFYSPYRAANIIEFWQRWHITLSQFLKDYLYIPLGGNRKGEVRRYINVFVTMLIGGIWHGAGWNFIIWGAMHGLFILTNHVWRDHVSEMFPGPSNRIIWKALCHAITMICVCVAWAFFRASTPNGALAILYAIGTLFFNFQFPDNVLASTGGLVMMSIAGLIVACPINSRNIHDWLFANRNQYRLSIGVGVGILAAISLMFITSGSPFLYFQF
jgi:alginate O-acetyltransferase complex protein AlgI